VQNGVVRQYVEGATVSWVDCNDVAAVAAEALLKPDVHGGKVYRLGYDAKSFSEIAQILTEEIGQPFRYEPRSPDEFLATMKAAGAEMAYMSCVYDHYFRYAAGTVPGAEDVFDNFKPIVGREPIRWCEFIRQHREAFKY
jgi:uncharacterized protein YbjT (DUF2867 family)